MSIPSNKLSYFYSSQCKANGKGCYSITCQKYSQNISASVREAFETVKSLIKEGSKYGYQLTSNLCISDKPEVAVEALKNLVKNLMRTKDEVIFFITKKHTKKSKISILFFFWKIDFWCFYRNFWIWCRNFKKFNSFHFFRLSKTFLLEFPLFPLPAMLVMDRKYP